MSPPPDAHQMEGTGSNPDMDVIQEPLSPARFSPTPLAELPEPEIPFRPGRQHWFRENKPTA